MSNDEASGLGLTTKLFEIAVSVALLIGGAYIASLSTDIKEGKAEDIRIRAEAAAFREQVAKENVRKEEYRQDIGEIKRLLEGMDRKLDRKIDRDAPIIPGNTVGPGVWRAPNGR